MRKFNGYEKGVNLGGWFSQCCHTQEHYSCFITEKDFEELSHWGLDHVRLPIDYNLLEDKNGNFIPEGLAHLKRAVSWCEKYGFNMVLDLHKTSGYSFDEGEAECGFFDNEKLQQRFYRLWDYISAEFGKYPDRIAFELLNEVTDKSYCDKWNTIAEKCISCIRKNAPDTYILVGGYWNNCVLALADLSMPYDDKIVYNFHCYEPLIFTHQGAYWVKNMPEDFRLAYPGTTADYAEKQHSLNLNVADLITDAETETVGTEFFDALFSKAAEIAEERNVPLYCGEYGVIDRADKKSAIEWYKAINASFKKYGISRAAWCYKQMDFGLVDDRLCDEVKMYL